MKRITKTDVRQVNLLTEGDYIVIQEREKSFLPMADNRFWTDVRVAVTVDELRKILAKVEAGAGK